MKKITALFISIALLFSCTQTTLIADESIQNDKIIDLSNYEVTEECIYIPVNDAEYIKTKSGKLLKISEMPNFSSLEEAKNYYSSLPPISTPVPRDSRGNQLVDSYKFNSNLNSLYLYVSYTTSGNNYTGQITSHNAYTILDVRAGVYDYDEQVIWSQITTTGKDIMAESAGMLILYLFINGSIQLSSEYVRLQGTAFAIK